MLLIAMGKYPVINYSSDSPLCDFYKKHYVLISAPCSSYLKVLLFINVLLHL